MICLPFGVGGGKAFLRISFLYRDAKDTSLFFSLLSLLSVPFSLLPHLLPVYTAEIWVFGVWPLRRALADSAEVLECCLCSEIWTTQGSTCLLLFGAGCILPYLTASLDYSAFFPSKSKCILQMSFPLTQSHLVIPGILNFAYLLGPNKGKLINERCDSVSV